MIAISMFIVVLALLLVGIPVAFVFGSIAIAFAFFIPELGLEVFNVLPFRIYGIMSNMQFISIHFYVCIYPTL
jgi:TRAP-type mannitol/chloroaromatic compound transport system permease large subunit